ncbi:AlbA family DNA-binding domain-containing protein [Clostridium ihumii]|uniref:AlbA family DNA-binding domain-containing protein n=1 Tax=Clostridium ihumii TaxID=1470356 RepID=UPI00054E982E|nr:RNA-binding domain-containing protein [Clostridium ihumii]
MDNKKVKTLLKKEEGTKLDFKRKIDIYTESGKKELAKDVCAIANSRGGRGYIIIGVEDKSKEIVGIDDERLTEEKVQQIVSSRCEPPIPVSLEFINYKNKKVGIITIYTSDQSPYQIRENGSFYIRRGSTTDTMRRDEIITMFSNSLSLTIESIPIMKSSIIALDIPMIDMYFQKKGFEIDDENREELMENAGIVYLDKESGKKVLTLGSALIFTKFTSIYLPHNMIKIINKVSNKRENTIVISGNILYMLDEAEAVIKEILPEIYPIEAVIEAINNAIMYRDYSMYNKFIEVIIGYKSIVIISPGCLLKTIGGNKENYIRRNMWIYEKIITIDEKKRFLKKFSGFTIIKKKFKRKGEIHFINDEERNIFKVVLPGVKNFNK